MKNVVIAGGGSGGHIYPGLAVAKVLDTQHYKVHWVGASGGLEEKIVSRENLPLHLIRIGKLHHTVGLWTRLKTIFGFPRAFWQAIQILRKLKPVAVLGVGGFASGPLLFVAALFRVRMIVWEPNAKAGMTNRILSRFADECLLVFEDALRDLKSKKTFLVGLPVRASIQPSRRSPVKDRAFRVLVFGGSQGARAINRAISQWAASDQWPEGIEMIHQTGHYDYAETKKKYDALARPGITCLEYIHNMDERYAWADLIICRAGASTAAELAAAGKAAIFIPLPTAADDHQLINARVFERAGAALVIEQKNLTVESLSSAVRRFQNEPVLVEQFERAVRQFASPQAAEVIAAHVVGSKR